MLSNQKILFLIMFTVLFIACNLPDRPSISKEEKQQEENSQTTDIQQAKNAQDKLTIEVTKIDTLKLIKYIILRDFPNQEPSHHKALTVDINKDQKSDIVAITKRTCNEEDDTATEYSDCHTVAIFLNKGNGEFELAATNNHLVECSDCGGAGVGHPHQSIKFENGILSFESLYGACDKTNQFINFHYEGNGNQWWLHSIETSDYSCRDTGDDETIAQVVKKTKEDFGSIRFIDFKH